MQPRSQVSRFKKKKNPPPPKKKTKKRQMFQHGATQKSDHTITLRCFSQLAIKEPVGFQEQAITALS